MEKVMIGIIIIGMISTMLGNKEVSKLNLIAWQFIALIWVAICIIEK